MFSCVSGTLVSGQNEQVTNDRYKLLRLEEDEAEP
jgi:hypothetical protein